MFKKSLVTIAALGAFAGSAFAGVTLYGTVDGGFQYTNSKVKGEKSESAFKLADGIGSANKFGIKGEEKISDDLSVGFKLENGFHVANGAMKPGVLFDREAVLYVKSVAGTLAVGREGAISSGDGMFGQFGSKVAAYSNGRGEVQGMKWTLAKVDRMNQTLTYESPKFGGVKVLAQYANLNDKQEGHGYVDSKKNNLFYALGATYSDDTVYGTALVDVTKKFKAGEKNAVRVSLGGNVKLDGFQVFAAGQYFKDAPLTVDALNATALAAKTDVKGFGLNAGVAVPVATGSLKGNLGYMHAKKAADDKVKLNRFVVGAVYDYPLSKSTFIYSGVGASFEKYKGVEKGKNARSFAANLGLTHNF